MFTERRFNSAYLARKIPVTHEVGVHIIDGLNFSSQFEFPFDATPASLLNTFGVVLDRGSREPGTLNISAATGRGGYKDPVAFQYTGPNPAVFTTIYEKGNGIGDEDAAAWAILSGSNYLLLNHWKQFGVPPYEYFRGNREIGGMAILDDAKLDALKSRILHEHFGVRTRLPIVCLAVTDLPVQGQKVSIIELQERGWPIKSNKRDAPTIAVMAKRYPHSFRDLKRLLEIHVENPAFSADMIVSNIMAHAWCIGDLKLKRIAREYLFAELQHSAQDTRMNAENTMFDWVATAYGKQMKIFKLYKIYHGMLTDHNIYPLVEFDDNSATVFGAEHYRDHHAFEEAHAHQMYTVIDEVMKLKTNIDAFRGVRKSVTQKTIDRLEHQYYKGYRENR